MSWADGSRAILQGEEAGLNAADQTEPCIDVTPTGGGLRLSKDDASLILAPGEDEVIIECSGGSRIEVSSFHFREFRACRGLVCPP